MTSTYSAIPHSERPLNTWDGLKLLGLLCMLIDHAGFFFFPDYPALRAIGQPGIAIFMFLTGYAPKHRVTRELLLAAAVMFAINTYLAGGLSTLNVIFTLIAGRLLLQQVEAGRLSINRPLEWFVVLVLLFPTVLIAQTGTLGLLFVIAGYLHRHKDRYPVKTRAWFFILSFAIYSLIDGYALHLATPHALLLYASMAAMGWLLWRTEVKPLALPGAPLWKFLARHMLWVYVIHFGVLQLMFGMTY